ncbi:MAG: two-component system response regulator [Methanomicrobiales archaeon HGW-Methanomicrobiales-5]|nr:MAG: two-component system response regulator [Methanomicrobiales archaeon HGW-Methanomicrobiales-5]
MDDSILIVDDSPYIVDGLVALLKRKGFKPIAAHGGDEAISLLTVNKPDLILLDIMMEPMDGWETLEKIKANPDTHNLPVLMFSAKKISPEEANEHSLNIEDFVSKPVNPAQLLDAIKRIFERRSNVKLEASVAKDAGLDAAIIGEYSALRKSIDVDKNILAVLKNSSGMHIPGRVIPEDDMQSINKLEEKIKVDEIRLKAINEAFSKGG